MVDYNKRLVEVDEILEYFSEEDLIKIPDEVRKEIRDNMDEEYYWEYYETKSLKDQDVSKDTITILAYLNMEYLLDEEQKKLMQEIYELNEKKSEEAKAEKYSVEDLFKRNKYQEEEKGTQEVKALVKCEESKWYQKLFNKILNIFKR